MESFVIFLVKFLILLYHGHTVQSYMVGNNPFHRVETLDTRGKYILEWRVDWPQERITFNVTVETTGYVGFGLSAKGKMSGADIVIGGVFSTGKSYFSDKHAVGNQFPEEDPSQDWTLHEARETKGHTFLSFSRAFDTCDPQDYPITEDSIYLIWAYGERDDSNEYHLMNRGVFPVHLLQPDYTPPMIRNPKTGAPLSIQNGENDIKVWTIPRSITIPARETTYLCSIHAAPNITRKHHVIGLDVRIPTEQDRLHVHHVVIYKCHTPRGSNIDPHSMFGAHIHHYGQTCYEVEPAMGPMPTEYCSEAYHVWAIGGRSVFHPPHVGIPLNPNDYLMVQTHYDNPNVTIGRRVNFEVDFFYTSKLRRYDGGTIVLGRTNPGLPPATIIPPTTPDITMQGHCSPECTQRLFPPNGINIFMLNLHSHEVGTSVKLQHFRQGRELPYIAWNDNYSVRFQQVRVLNKEGNVLPGDQMTVTCKYDNTLVNNGTTVGGYSTRQEMCNVFALYYSNLNDYFLCRSDHNSVEFRQKFLAGVTNITWQDSILQYTVDPPHPLAGLTIKEVSDNHVKWDWTLREELQRFHDTNPQHALCPLERFAREPGSTPEENGVISNHFVGYPYVARPYELPKSCSFK